MESELFGHTKGAFTDARTDKKGLFRSAEGGTLFLDEIGEVSQSLQVKLLRALQEHEIMPVGAGAAVKFDARIVAATNKNLDEEVSKGAFREDLFYRLNVIEIQLPSLRERREDIPLLAKHFAARIAREQHLAEKQISKEAMSVLVNYNWQGNIRELQNAVERSFILSGAEIDLESLPPRVRQTALNNLKYAIPQACARRLKKSNGVILWKFSKRRIRIKRAPPRFWELICQRFTAN